jgi:hypothetical protein
MKQGKTDIRELAIAIMDEASNKKDYVTPTQRLNVIAPDKDAKEGERDLKLEMTSDDGGDSLQFPLTQIASRQIGEKIGIPAKYFDRMLKDAPDLLVHNANHWLESEPKDVMIRTLFGNARAVLSNKYQRIDNVDIAENILPVLLDQQSNGLEIASCEVTDKKLYIKAVMHSLQREVKKGDIVEAGLWISNSEIGYGVFEVAPFIHRLVCLNGMKVNDAKFGKRHVGTRADVNDTTYSILSQETLQADDKAFMLKARDVVQAAFNEKVFDSHVDKLRDTTDRQITGKVVKAVEVLGQTTGLLQNEQEGILNKLISGADLSQYGMVQAVTAYSQDVDSYDRASELEELGGKIVDLTPSQWNPIATAA